MRKTWILALVVTVVILGGIVAATYLSHLSNVPPISLSATTLSAVQGTVITFSVYGLESSGIATVYFGDGQQANTTSMVTHSYANPGRYLLAAQEWINGLPVASTFSSIREIQITPQIDPARAPFISIPAIWFDVSKNPSAPVVQVGETVYLSGGFLEAPSGTDISISKYVWSFGNGANQTILANSTSHEPVSNPVKASYSQPGLYAVTLTLETSNVSSSATYGFTVEQTLALSSPSELMTLFLYTGNVPNPSVINVAENQAGGPYSFDPQVDYESVGFEVIVNICSTLITYNGSSTSQFISMAATQVPSITNGGISPNYTLYTFQIRQGLKFSNGDPLSAYDVWYSMVRDMLFVGGSPGTPDWILAQYLIPGATIGVPILMNATDSAHFNAIINAVTYSNSSQTITFKLVNPTAPQLFLTALADPAGAGILDSNWLQQVGAGITFTPAGFFSYQSQGDLGGYNLKVQNSPVASGPYMIQSYVPGQSVTLVGNPGFSGVPGIPALNNTVLIQWVKDPETAYDLFTSGQVDIVTTLPTNYEALIPKQVASGQASLYQFPTLSAYFYEINLDVNVAAMKADFGSQYKMPHNYFANLKVRKAFAFAFNYTNYIDELQGKTKYNMDFGSNYAGLIIQGLPYHVPENMFQNVPAYNLTYAKQLLQESGEYNDSINIPIIVNPGDTVDFAASQMWAAALNSVDPNIVMAPIFVPFSTEITYMVPNQNPMPIYYYGWFADYPYPSDFVDALYKNGGTAPAPNSWSVDYLNKTGRPDQALMYAEMNSLIQAADTTTNSTVAAQDYFEAQQLAISLYMYVYSILPNAFWILKPYMTGYQGQILYEENPMIGGVGDGLYFWWVKG